MQEATVTSPPNQLSWWKCFLADDKLLTDRQYLIVKRIFDVSIIMLASPLLFVLLGLCALLIKIESPSSPVLFFQKRTGKDGIRFDMFKFRTMVPNAEKLKEKYADLNELQWPDFKITNDPRITKLGRFLRKSSLDELPQVLNVVRGEMSLVGPRPTSFAISTYKQWHTVRLESVPGLTGLWQVVGRAEMEFDERVRLDYEYQKRRSFKLDLMIMVYTVGAIFQGK